MSNKYRKRPVVIEAVQFTGTNHEEVQRFDDSLVAKFHEVPIQTLEGLMVAKKGDWIIRGVNGELYPCKPDIFDKTYEAVDDDEPVGTPP